MPQRKNPAPKRVSADGPATPEIRPAIQMPQPLFSIPDDPKVLQEMPKESLYRENVIDSCTVTACDKREDGTYICRKCGKDYATMSGLRYHLHYQCEHVNRFRYTCLVCGKDCTNLEETLKHIAQQHLGLESTRRRRTKQLNKSYYTEDFEENETAATASSKEDYVPPAEKEEKEDLDISVEDDFVPGVKKNKTPLTTKSWKKGSSSASSSFATIQHPLDEALQWVFDFLLPLENRYKIVHPNFVPNYDLWVKNTDFDTSVFSKSPEFRIMEEEKKVALYEDPGMNPFTSSLPLQELSLELNVGGPVHALSWCPIPLKQHGSRQYLAVSTHSGLHLPDLCYNDEGLVQIWDCGKLNLHGHEDESPKFLYGISCCEAPIWDLKWCCVGGSIVTENNSDAAQSRLGILGAACASGKVLILSIPDPKAADFQSDSGIYHAKPGMVLLPCCGGRGLREQTFGQCLSIDWTLSDGGQWITGGYSKGFVALWKIQAPSSLLLSKGSGGLELIACRTFLAHNKAVRSVCWCPYDETILATAGQDRYLKIWNRNHTEAPIMVPQAKISMPTEITWPLLWCGVFSSTDEVFAGPWHHGLLYHDILTQVNVPTAVIQFKSACLTLSFSDWLNCIAGGDSAGLVVTHPNSNLNRKVKNQKSVPKLRLFNTNVKWTFEDSENEENHDDCKKYQLTFQDTNFKKLKDIVKRPCFKNVRLQDSYPATVCDKPYVQAVNRLAWNPNFGSHSWIASGLQCGLVRLHCVGDMHSDVMDTIFRDLTKELG